ncbi:Outer membrane protein assembly complex factor [Desulfonema limicola]|uniref:Outer membrane protein assembly factor BamA n=1 Tax=Desulfonema limicola TaxID=45656 RepID=A0A975BC55_9BACT|nr:outer membrane protein assembly factor BamA [Desulfonema limicola]QTA82666.1 Outer membrane protein assembly complex factor [Desulfonema limicola]
MRKKHILQAALPVLFIIISIFPAYTQASGPLIKAVDIIIKDTPGNSQYLKDAAQSLINLKPGDRFSGEKLGISIELLKQSGLFKSIEVPDPDWNTEEITLVFHLTPFKRIRDIKITGAFPLFEREILNAMTIYAGDVFSAEKLTEQQALISRVFIDEGYIEPHAMVSSHENKDNGDYNILVNIEKNDFYKIKELEIQGNHAFSKSRLKLRTSIWKDSLLIGEMRRFVQKDVDKDLKNLVKFYLKKGYADVEITPEIKKDRDLKQVSVIMNINEGPKYKIEFEGNEEFWDFTLKKDLVLAQRGNKNNLGLRKSIRNIQNRYQEAGYPDVKISMEEQEPGDPEKNIRKIKIVIEEGTRFIVESVNIAGNKALDSDKIKKQILTRTPGIIADGEFVPENLEEDKDAVKSLYLKQGYMETEVKDSVTWKDDPKEESQKLAEITLDVNEGRQTLVKNVFFKNLNALTHEEALGHTAHKPGEPFRSYMIQSDENTIAALISEKGYPHAEVKGEVEFGSDNTEAVVTYNVSEGVYVEMGPVYVTGNFRTKDKVILNEAEIKKGEPFSLKKMLETNKNIRDINALESADFKALGLNEKSEKVILLVNTEEKKPYYVQFGGGYDTRKHFYANVKAGDHNLFGLNKDSWVSAELSQIGYRGEAGLTEPRFMGTRISSTLSGFAEEIEEFNKDFGTRTYGASLGFDRKFMQYFTARLAFRYEFREQYLTEDKYILPEDEEKYDPRSILVTTPALIYNSTDSFIRPRKGLYSSFSLDISKGLGETLDDFFKYRFETRYYYTPLEGLTFAVRGRYGYLDPFGSESSVPDDQLFFLGGTSDVRGFDENKLRYDRTGDPDGGRSELLGSLEARIDLGMNFELTAFYDIGNIQETLSDTSDDFRSSAGLGLRYITPIGPVGFLYGWKLDREEDEGKGRFHFTLGYTF